MKKLATALLAILTVAVVLMLVVAAVWALIELVGLEGSLFWTVIVGGIAWLIRSNIERKRAHEELLAETKRESYFRFIDFLTRYLGKQDQDDETSDEDEEVGGNKNEADDNEEIAVGRPTAMDLRTWSMKLTMIASDNVIRCWNQARNPPAGMELTTMLALYGQLLLEMRKDCGHYKTELTVVDVLSTFINDLDLSGNGTEPNEESSPDTEVEG